MLLCVLCDLCGECNPARTAKSAKITKNHDAGRRRGAHIAQIGVAPAHRGEGLETIILRELARRTASETLVFVNVEEGDYLAGHMVDAGFARFIGQYEMAYRFTEAAASSAHT